MRVARRYAVGLAALVLFSLTATPSLGESVRVKVWTPGIAEVLLERSDDGQFVYALRYEDGRRARISADEFAALLHRRAAGRPLWQRVLNVSSPVGIAWVALGLAGQLAFTARMLFQWWRSERAQRSVVPAGFWWLSLVGASMLLVYFVWRKDVVGILGQAAGFLIYARNLWLIRHSD